MKVQKRKISSRVYERYISPQILSAIIRPQETAICVLTSIISAIHAVFGVSLETDDVLEITGWELDDDELGNEDVVDGLNAICKNYGLKGFADGNYRGKI
jgi:hypothetical protein